MTGSTGGLWGREVNPVLVKELRARFRGPRAFSALTLFLLVLAVVALWVYWLLARESSMGSGVAAYNPAARAIGRDIFSSIAVLEMLFVALLGPALTMNAISGEVERQTYDMLLATPLSAWSIVLGKAGSALAYVALLIVAALPVMSLAFVFGGVTAQAVLLVQLAVLTAGLLFVSVVLFYSSLFKRTARAAVFGYLTVGLLSVGVLVLSVLSVEVAGHGTYSDWWAVAQLELSPIEPLIAILQYVDTTSWDDAVLFVAQSLVLQLILAAGLLVLAAWRVRKVGREGTVALALVVLALWGWLAWVATSTPQL